MRFLAPSAHQAGRIYQRRFPHPLRSTFAVSSTLAVSSPPDPARLFHRAALLGFRGLSPQIVATVRCGHALGDCPAVSIQSGGADTEVSPHIGSSWSLPSTRGPEGSRVREFRPPVGPRAHAFADTVHPPTRGPVRFRHPSTHRPEGQRAFGIRPPTDPRASALSASIHPPTRGPVRFRHPSAHRPEGQCAFGIRPPANPRACECPVSVHTPTRESACFRRNTGIYPVPTWRVGTSEPGESAFCFAPTRRSERLPGRVTN